MSKSWKKLWWGAGVLAVLGTLFFVSPLLADHEPRGTGLPDEGVLRLHLGADGDYFRYDAHNTVPPGGAYGVGTPRYITSSGCTASTEAGEASLFAFPASSKVVGLRDHELGIKSSGSSCGSVEQNEGGVAIQLAGTLATKEIDYFEVDIELKQTVTVTAEKFLGTTSVGSVSISCTPGADCGNDSSAGDNFRWVHVAAVPFNKIVFRVTSTNNGNFSLGGGFDGTPAAPVPSLGDTLTTTDSLFHITDLTVINCGGSSTTGTAGTSPVSNLTRGAVDLTGGNCDPKVGVHSVNQDADQQSVSFIEVTPNCSSITAQFTETINWEPFLDASPTSPTRTLQYQDPCAGDPPGTNTSIQDMLPCNGNPTPLTADSDEVLPNGHTHCVYGSSWTIVGFSEGQYLVDFTDNIYWIGDGGKFR